MNPDKKNINRKPVRLQFLKLALEGIKSTGQQSGDARLTDNSAHMLSGYWHGSLSICSHGFGIEPTTCKSALVG